MDEPTEEERAELKRFAEQFLADLAANREAQRSELRKAYDAGAIDTLGTIDKPTGEDIVRAYYKAKRSYPKLTLRKYLQDLGIPEREGYIRKVKVAYDKRKPGRRRGNTKR